MAKSPSEKPELVTKVAKEATADWLAKTGRIGHRDELDVSKTFNDYQVTPADIADLSRHVREAIKKTTGHDLKLPADWAPRHAGKSISTFVEALPGHSSTGSSGPIDD